MTTFKLIRYFILGSALLCNSAFAAVAYIYVTGNAAAGSTYQPGTTLVGQCVGTLPPQPLVITCTTDAQGHINTYGTIYVNQSCQIGLIAIIPNEAYNILPDNHCYTAVVTSQLPIYWKGNRNAKGQIEINSPTSTNLNTPK